MYTDKTGKQDNKEEDVVWTQGRQEPTEGRGEGILRATVKEGNRETAVHQGSDTGLF